MILVTGGTGKVGSELIKQLQSRGAQFKALAHSDSSADKLSKQGVQTVRGDVSEIDTVRQALNGVDKLFLLTPSSERQVRIENAVIDAAKEAGVKHIVKLSVADAGNAITVLKLHGDVETHLKASGVAYTLLQANTFMQNFLESPTIKHNSAIFAPTGKAKMAYIDARDVAELAAIALMTGGHENKTYLLSGERAYSHGEIARIASDCIGKPVQFVDLSSEDYRASLIQAGLPAWYADGLQELFAYYKEGNAARTSTDVARVTGHPARTMDAFFAEYAPAFQ